MATTTVLRRLVHNTTMMTEYHYYRADKGTAYCHSQIVSGARWKLDTVDLTTVSSNAICTNCERKVWRWKKQNSVQ